LRAPQTPIPQFMMDAPRIVLLFNNLINNAIIYSLEGGRVEVALEKTGGREDCRDPAP